MRALSTQISKGLILHDFEVAHDEYPPHELTGSCEALGFDIWLNYSDVIEGYNYIFYIESGISDDELLSGHMHDLSLWLGRYISFMCDLDTCILDENKNQTAFKAKAK